MSDQIRKFAGIEMPPELGRKNFFFMYLCTMLAGLMVTMTALVYPAFLVDVIGIDQRFAGSINGFLHTLNQAATLLLVAYIGMLSDKIGRKRLVLSGFLAISVFYFLLTRANDVAAWIGVPPGIASGICAFASWRISEAAGFLGFAPGLLVMYATCLLLSLGFVTAFPQFIIIVADYTYEKDRGKGMAMNGIMIGTAGMIVFLAFAPLMARIGVVGLLRVASGIAIVGAVFTALFLKDRLAHARPEKASLLDVIPVVRARLPIKASYLCSLLVRADIAVLSTFLITWSVKHGTALGLSAEAASNMARKPMIIFSMASFLFFPLIGVMLDRVGRVPVIITSLFCGAAGMLSLVFAPDPFHWVTYVAAALLGVGFSGSVAGPNALAADAAPEGKTGAVLGGLNTMAPLGTILFLLIGGYLFDHLGPVWAFGVKGGGTLLVAIWMLASRRRIMEEIRCPT